MKTRLLFFSGAKSATPDQGSDANICPRGSYCLQGTDEPEPCPAGTFSNALGKFNHLCKYSLLIIPSLASER